MVMLTRRKHAIDAQVMLPFKKPPVVACIRHRKVGWSLAGSSATQNVLGSPISVIIPSIRSGGVLFTKSGEKTVGAQRG